MHVHAAGGGKGYTLHAHASGDEKRYTSARLYCWRGKGYWLTYVEKSEANAGKKPVRHRQVYFQSAATVRHQNSDIRFSPIPLVTDYSSIVQYWSSLAPVKDSNTRRKDEANS